MSHSDVSSTASADTFPAWFVEDTHWLRTGIPLAVALLLLTWRDSRRLGGLSRASSFEHPRRLIQSACRLQIHPELG